MMKVLVYELRRGGVFLKRELVSNYREIILAKITNLSKGDSVTIKNMTNMEMIISPAEFGGINGAKLVSNELFEINITNCQAIYKSITISKEDLEYYISMYQKATTGAESYNIYLLASKGLKIGSTIEIVDTRTKNKTIGVISGPNKHYYGLFYKSKNPFSKLKTIDLLLDNSTPFNILHKDIKMKF